MGTTNKFQVPSLQQGWGTSYYGSTYLSGFFFDLVDQILYAFYPQQQFDVYLNANTTLAQGLSVANLQIGGGIPKPEFTQPGYNLPTADRGSSPAMYFV